MAPTLQAAALKFWSGQLSASDVTLGVERYPRTQAVQPDREFLHACQAVAHWFPRFQLRTAAEGIKHAPLRVF